jgi:hypothetical protein
MQVVSCSQKEQFIVWFSWGGGLGAPRSAATGSAQQSPDWLALPTY